MHQPKRVSVVVNVANVLEPKTHRHQHLSVLCSAPVSLPPATERQIELYCRSPRVKRVKRGHGGSQSSHRVTNIATGCNSCGCVFNLDGGAEWRSLKPNPGFHKWRHEETSLGRHSDPDVNPSGLWFGSVWARSRPGRGFLRGGWLKEAGVKPPGV